MKLDLCERVVVAPVAEVMKDQVHPAATVTLRLGYEALDRGKRHVGAYVVGRPDSINVGRRNRLGVRAAERDSWQSTKGPRRAAQKL